MRAHLSRPSQEVLLLRQVPMSTPLTSGCNFCEPLPESFGGLLCVASLLPHLHHKWASRSFIKWYVEDFRAPFPGSSCSTSRDYVKLQRSVKTLTGLFPEVTILWRCISMVRGLKLTCVLGSLLISDLFVHSIVCG